MDRLELTHIIGYALGGLTTTAHFIFTGSDQEQMQTVLCSELIRIRFYGNQQMNHATPTVRLWVFRHSGIRLRLRENDSCTQELTVQKLLSKTTGFAGGFGFHTGHR